MAYFDINKRFKSEEDIADYALTLWDDFPAQSDGSRTRVVVSYLYRNAYDAPKIAKWITDNIEDDNDFDTYFEHFYNWVKKVKENTFTLHDNELMLSGDSAPKTFAEMFPETPANTNLQQSAQNNA